MQASTQSHLHCASQTAKRSPGVGMPKMHEILNRNVPTFPTNEQRPTFDVSSCISWPVACRGCRKQANLPSYACIRASLQGLWQEVTTDVTNQWQCCELISMEQIFGVQVDVVCTVLVMIQAHSSFKRAVHYFVSSRVECAHAGTGAQQWINSSLIIHGGPCERRAAATGLPIVHDGWTLQGTGSLGHIAINLCVQRQQNGSEHTS
jgi:hypothetical protein